MATLSISSLRVKTSADASSHIRHEDSAFSQLSSASWGSRKATFFSGDLTFNSSKATTAFPVARKAGIAVAEKTDQPPTVGDTKAAFLKAFRRPIPSIYNSVLQELLVQQHLTRYNRTYQYDPVFALGFVTVFDQLMDGYPNPDDRDAIFAAYINALTEDPVKYRADASALEEWAKQLNADSLISFGSREGNVEAQLKEISARASGKTEGVFHYSRFFAIGLFRLLELAQASEPAVLEKLCEALGVNKMSVNRDLDVYRGLLNKLTIAKDLLRDFLEREKKKKEERAAEKAKVSSE